MKTITIPSNLSRDQRDLLVHRAARQIDLALRRIERLRADQPPQCDAKGKDRRPC